jgi:hypothetical protein
MPRPPAPHQGDAHDPIQTLTRRRVPRIASSISSAFSRGHDSLRETESAFRAGPAADARGLAERRRV